jgi:hypothetical protein
MALDVVKLPLRVRGAGRECDEGAGGKTQAQPVMAK